MRLSNYKEIDTFKLISGKWGVLFDGKTYAKFETEKQADDCMIILAMNLRKERRESNGRTQNVF